MRRAIVVTAVSGLVTAVAAVGSAASLTVTTSNLGAAAVTTPVMFPDSVTIANKFGNVAGRAENGDTVTLVFSRQLDLPTLCSGASNASSTISGSVTWAIINGANSTNDTLGITAWPSSCTNGFRVGSINLGSAGYNTSTTNISFPSTTVVTVGATTTTISVTLAGRIGGSPGTVATGSAAIWTPDSAVTDRNGRSCGANLARTSATVQF